MAICWCQEKVLLTLAAFYTVQLTVTRESIDEEVLKAFKRISLKAHPDKGGRLEHCQLLNSAKDTWDAARRGKKAGRPSPQQAEQRARGPDGPTTFVGPPGPSARAKARRKEAEGRKPKRGDEAAAALEGGGGAQGAAKDSTPHGPERPRGGSSFAAS